MFGGSRNVSSDEYFDQLFGENDNNIEGEKHSTDQVFGVREFGVKPALSGVKYDLSQGIANVFRGEF